MFVHAIEGSWFSHPFVKAGFLLETPEDVQALRNSQADAVIIDTSRGVDVAEAAPSPSPPQPTPTPPPVDIAANAAAGIKPPLTFAAEPAERAVPADAPIATSPGLPCGLAEEIDRANRIAAHAKLVMTELYDQARLGRIVEAETLTPIVDDIVGSIARNRSALTSILRLKSKDEYTYVHSVAVSALMINLAREIGGFDADTMRDLGVAGLLHDIGKMAMPEDVLGKPGDLTREEFSIMKTHPERGHDLLLKSRDVPSVALDVCLHHHEKVNGTGYPGRLRNNRISGVARMGAICDVYDALTSNRPYKTAWGPNMALKTMFGWRGHFDPEMLTAFIRSVGIYPVGTLVRLRSEHLAFVTDINGGDLTRPKVRAFFSVKTHRPIAPHDIDLLHAPDGDAIVQSENPSDWNLGDWETQWRAAAA